MYSSARKVAALVALASISAISTAAAQDENSSSTLEDDTVICIRNEIPADDAVTVIQEIFKDRKPNVRTATIPNGKSACLRYRNLREVRPYFLSSTEWDAEAGAIKDGAEVTRCLKTKNGFAKYYVMTESESGRKQCVVDSEISKETIRSYVEGAKAINS